MGAVGLFSLAEQKTERMSLLPPDTVRGEKSISLKRILAEECPGMNEL